MSYRALCKQADSEAAQTFHPINRQTYALTQMVEALRYKPEGRGFDSRSDGVTEIFIDIILLSPLWPLGRLSL